MEAEGGALGAGGCGRRGEGSGSWEGSWTSLGWGWGDE